ncbi:transposase [Mycoavidus cysteinexigens]|nr:transposase [Mycoavidus cysteinexigens]
MKLQTSVKTGRRFVACGAREIYLGSMRLEDYLKHANQRIPLIVSQLLDAQDWEPFEQRYAATGRAPYSPRYMMGLILYGVMQGVSSLRDLEKLARLDLGCMWVAGGITPDHANIGRFIVMHEESLTQGFFESLTGSILKASHSNGKRLAGDGTIIEAPCSHYKLLKEEAVRERVIKAHQALEKAPDSKVGQKELEKARQCQALFDERLAARKIHNGKGEVFISAQEPEAVVQRLKRGRGFAASYKPSVLANEDRIVVAHALHASSETRVMATMLEQSKRTTGQHAAELLLDAGYFDNTVIQCTLDREISLLCSPDKSSEEVKGEKKFRKGQFQYDAIQDTYRCPAGQDLHVITQTKPTALTRARRIYAITSCEGCALRTRCTKSAVGRRIERYPEDEARDALRIVMQHPQARRILSQRKVMVEPVFSALRRCGLDRFRRQGLQAVKREFALHILAYNLSKAVALLWGRLLLATIYCFLDNLRRTQVCY